MSAPAVVTGRCNPFGHETGGPRHLLGGIYGPEYEGTQKWTCHNAAEVRVRMACTLYGHEGPVMTICRAHMAEIQKRMAGLCTRCAYPPEAVEYVKDIETAQAELALLNQRGRWNDMEAVRLRDKIERLGHKMTELYQTGRIRRVPMKLTEIS